MASDIRRDQFQQKPTIATQLQATADNLTLPENMTSFEDFPAINLSPMASLQRGISNPLIRGVSNASVSSDNGGAHFVPFGRGLNDGNEMDSESDNNHNRHLMSRFNFNNKVEVHIDDEMVDGDDGVDCITPVNLVPSLVGGGTMAPLIEVDTDYDTRTHTTTSSQRFSSQPQPQLNSQPQPAELNAETAEFVPGPAAAHNMFYGNGMIMPPQQLPLMLPMAHAPMMLRPAPIQTMPSLLLPPMLGIAAQGSLLPSHMPQQHTPIQPQQQQHTPQRTPQRTPQHTPHTTHSASPNSSPYRNHMAVSYHDIVANQSPDVNSTNDSRSPISAPVTPPRMMWRNTRNTRQQAPRQQPQQQAPPRDEEYEVEDDNESSHSTTVDLRNLEIPEIIKLNASLHQLLRNRLICQFMKHQNGSRYIQEKLKHASSDDRLTILRHIVFIEHKLLELSEDIFGNYVIQIFFDMHCDAQHELLLHHLLRGNVYTLSRSFYGCRVIQKAFDCLSRSESQALIAELRQAQPRAAGAGAADDNEHDRFSVIHDCIICPNANHVIQKIITLGLDISHIQFIIDCIDTNIAFYSGHIFGCRIVQNIINYYGYHDDKRMLREMVSRENLLHLCQSQYGNYVIQHILKLSFHGGRDQCEQVKQSVVRNVFSNVVYLSKNKYGSNVVENCLQFATDKQRDFVLDQIIGGAKKSGAAASAPPKQHAPRNQQQQQQAILCDMVKHKFANYVIQKLLTFGNARQKLRLVQAIERGIPNLRTLNFGKHIMEKVKQIKQQQSTSTSNYSKTAQQQQHHQQNVQVSPNKKRFYGNY